VYAGVAPRFDSRSIANGQEAAIDVSLREINEAAPFVFKL
jgi:hypothetical protein